MLVVERNNYREEAYFTYSYSPIKHSDGRIGGVFSAISETTERVLGERRLRILRELAAQTAESKTVQAACEAFARVLGGGNPDLPFALLYLSNSSRSLRLIRFGNCRECPLGSRKQSPSSPSKQARTDGLGCLRRE